MPRSPASSGHSSSWKQEWKTFAAQDPGRRFRNRHERLHSGRAGRPWWRRALNFGGGVVLLAVGVFFAIAPGPAVVFFALGGLMIANESHAAARGLDAIDVWIAPLLQWAGRRWRKLSPTGRRVATGCMISFSVAALVAGIFFMR